MSHREWSYFMLITYLDIRFWTLFLPCGWKYHLKNKVSFLFGNEIMSCSLRETYQDDLLGTRDCNKTFKHLESLNKSATLPKNSLTKAVLQLVKMMMSICSTPTFNLYTPRKVLSVWITWKVKNPTPTNFIVCRSWLRELLQSIDLTKSRQTNGLPRICFQETTLPTCSKLHKIMQKINRLRKIVNCW